MDEDPATTVLPGAPPPPTGASAPTAPPSAEVIDAFVALADSLVVGYDPADLVAHLVERAVQLLGVGAAGILLADARGRLQLAASSSDAMRDLELLQLSVADGPCLECYATGAPVLAVRPGDVEERWPRFAPAMREQGLASVVAVPLRLRTQTLGALGMFSSTWNTPTSSAARVAQGLADIATIALLHDRAASDSRALSAQLQDALDTRVLVEQAKGVVAAQLGTTVVDAFLVLRTTARHRGLPLRDLCLALVEGRIDARALDA